MPRSSAESNHVKPSCSEILLNFDDIIRFLAFDDDCSSSNIRNIKQNVQLSGNSDKGCGTFSGKEISTGNDVFISKWVFDVDQISSKCPIHCKNIAKPDKCKEHRIKDSSKEILEEFIGRAKLLIDNVNHFNLINYLNFNIIEEDGKIVIYVVQEYIQGKSIKSLRDEGKLPNVAAVAKAIVKVISQLQNLDPEVTHGYLNDKSIFLDNSAVCRVADFDLIPYLMYLKGTLDRIHEVSDLEAFSLLISEYHELMSKSTLDFINKCRSGKVLSYSNLLQDPFLSNEWFTNNKSIYGDSLLDNFDIVKQLGSGGFGIVLEAKKHIDRRSYAIKFIKIPTKSKKEFEQMEREAQLISGINHKNVVRYITSWQQKINSSELEKFAGDASMIFSQSTQSSDSTNLGDSSPK